MNEWKYLSPIAIAYFILSFAVKFIKDGLLNFAPLLAVFVTQVDDKLFWASIIIAALVVFLVVYSLLFFKSFRFKINSNQILLERGVFNKEVTTLSFEKVQNVNLSTPFYFEPFKAVNCIFDSAGSSQKEISLPGVSLTYAEKVRKEIMQFRRNMATTKFDAGSEAELGTSHDLDETSDYAVNNKPAKLKLSIKEIGLYGLSSNMTFILLAFLAPFTEKIIDFFKESFVPIFVDLLTQVLPEGQYIKILAGVLIVVLLVLFGLTLSVVSAVIQFYGFQFYDENKNLRRVAGLFDKHQISIAKHRIQAISIRQNWVFKLFKRVTVQFHQLAAGVGKQNKGKNNLAIPTLSQLNWPEFVSDSFQDLDMKGLEFIRISPRYISRTFTFNWLLPLSVISLFLMTKNPNWIWLNFVAVFGLAIVYLKWRRYGIWFSDKYIAIRTGFIGQKITILPTYKMQNISFQQTPMLKRNRLAHLTFQLPYGKASIPYLPVRLATALVNLSVYEIESNPKHWL